MTIQSKKMEILENGALLMHKKGYNHTGIQEILKAAQVPKGSFYFYFKSKEDFGLQVIDYFSHYVKGEISKYLQQEGIAYVQRIKSFFNNFLTLFVECDFQGGCPLGNLALEMADCNEIFREKLREQFRVSISAIQESLDKAIENGEIKNTCDSQKLAQFIFFSWEGMIMQMKLCKNKTPIENFNQMIFEELLK